MDLTTRQEIILNNLIKEYLDNAEPVSSTFLKSKVGLNVSPATIRNDLQNLTELGYVIQPHTSAGRIPTEKAYHYFVEITFSQNANIMDQPAFAKSFDEARQKIEKELELAQKLAESLTQISSTLSYTRIQNKSTIFEALRIIGPSQASYHKNVDLMKELLKEFENL